MPISRPHSPRSRRGFTMIELLTVIGIIVILMGILIPVISAVKKIAQKTTTAALIDRLAAACNNYYQDFRAYPGPIPDSAVHGYKYSIQQDIANGCKPQPMAFVLLTPITGAGTLDFTSTENLTLGLLGGLQPAPAGQTNSAGQNIYGQYNVALIPKGPIGLNQLAPTVYPAYQDPKSGELSDDGVGNYTSRTGSDPFLLTTAITGASNNPCQADTFVVPEFLDTFSIPRAIIYLRARPGAQYTCDLTSTNGGSGSQYYSGEMTPYAPNFFGQVDALSNGNILWPTFGNPQGSQPSEYGFAFFSNPSSSPGAGVADTGACRSRDSFIMISAGADGIYGTKDDVIYSN